MKKMKTKKKMNNNPKNPKKLIIFLSSLIDFESIISNNKFNLQIIFSTNHFKTKSIEKLGNILIGELKRFCCSDSNFGYTP